MTWELVEVTDSKCDECGVKAVCNVYRTEGCKCSACLDRRNYMFFHVCGFCMGAWLKRREQFKESD